jgi:hypothetical protein
MMLANSALRNVTSTPPLSSAPKDYMKNNEVSDENTE